MKCFASKVEQNDGNRVWPDGSLVCSKSCAHFCGCGNCTLVCSGASGSTLQIWTWSCVDNSVCATRTTVSEAHKVMRTAFSKLASSACRLWARSRPFQATSQERHQH
eukprot:scaffold316487_cov23-Tisochrysis_lutea.AAC.2